VITTVSIMFGGDFSWLSLFCWLVAYTVTLLASGGH
jgi:hypothetical protein